MRSGSVVVVVLVVVVVVLGTALATSVVAVPMFE